jgi:hypothetical protein
LPSVSSSPETIVASRDTGRDAKHGHRLQPIVIATSGPPDQPADARKIQTRTAESVRPVFDREGVEGRQIRRDDSGFVRRIIN